MVKSEVGIYEKYLIDYEEAEEEMHQSNSNKVVSLFKAVTNKCIVLLKAIFYDDKDIDSITKEFGYTNKHNAQNQKYKCLEQARKGVENLN
jgi:hypothetical protein